MPRGQAARHLVNILQNPKIKLGESDLKHHKGDEGTDEEDCRLLTGSQKALQKGPKTLVGLEVLVPREESHFMSPGLGTGASNRAQFARRIRSISGQTWF